jgi:hypothetical protein
LESRRFTNNAAGNFISPPSAFQQNAFDTVIDIFKGTKLYIGFWKTLIDTKQETSTVLIVTTYAWTGSAYVVYRSATAKAAVLAMT